MYKTDTAEVVPNIGVSVLIRAWVLVFRVGQEVTVKTPDRDFSSAYQRDALPLRLESKFLPQTVFTDVVLELGASR